MKNLYFTKMYSAVIVLALPCYTSAEKPEIDEISVKYDFDALSSKNRIRPASISSDAGVLLFNKIDLEKNDTKAQVLNNSSSKVITLTAAGASLASAISANGRIITGMVQNSSTLNAALWYGDNWEKLHILDKLTVNNTPLTNVPVTTEAKTIALTVSSDGSVVGGSQFGNNVMNAVIWSGPNWSKVDSLPSGIFMGSKINASQVDSLSGDGKVATGISMAENDFNKTYITVWSGDQWKDTVYPEKKSARVNAMSSDGKVIAGIYNNEKLPVAITDYSEGTYDVEARSAIYYGSRWGQKVELKSLGPDGKGYNYVSTLSSDGAIAGGSSIDERGNVHATLWSGPLWSEVTDLDPKSLGKDSFSHVTSLSGDGTVALGLAKKTLELGNQIIPVLWKIKWPLKPSQDTSNSNDNNKGVHAQPSQDNTNSKGINKDVPSQPQIVMVDVQNTQKTINKMASDVSGVLQLQYESLKRLNMNCTPEVGASCWATNIGFRSGNSIKESSTGFSMSTSLSDNIITGFSLDQSINRSLPASFTDSRNNTGAGLYITFHQEKNDGAWFITPALAFNRSTVTAKRLLLDNTEVGKGETEVNGLSLSLTTGQSYQLDDGSDFSWNVGVRRDEVKMDGWKESNSEFPLSWAGSAYKRTDFVAGLTSRVTLTSKLKWVNSGEFTQRIKGNNISVSATNPWLGNHSDITDVSKQIWRVSSGLSYSLTDNLEATAMPSIWKNSVADTSYGASVGLKGTF